MCHRATERLKASHNMRMLCIVLVGVYITFPGLLAWADTVYLKDGRILRDCRATQNGNTWAIEKGGATINLPAASVQKVDKSETRSAEAASEDKATAETTSTQDNTAATGRDLHYDYKLAEDLESMIVPDEMYPDGKCKIWVPTEKARSEYLDKTIFVPSSVAKEGRKFASVDDVVRDKSQFGYFFSTLPPQFVPVIDYPEDDKPIYSFVGQMVPGTNVKYTNPEIPAAWLVDVAEVDGKEVTVPALTTIDFHNFRSINWPRERYMKAIEKAREGRADKIISGDQKQKNVVLRGVVSVAGDYHVSRNQSLSLRSGPVIVISAKYDNSHKFGNKNLIQLQIEGNFSAISTVQNPAIITSNAVNPNGEDWQCLNIEPWSNTNMRYSITEYAHRNISLNGSNTHNPGRKTISYNIIRYAYSESESENLGPTQGLTFAYLKRSDSITNNELHNNRDNISTYGHNQGILVANNIIYNTLLPKHMTNECLHELGPNSNYVFWNNTLYGTSFWGVEIGVSDINMQNNIITNNEAGIMFYLLDGSQNPITDHNNLWNNNFGNYAKEITYGKWEHATSDGQNNISQDPKFINPAITDFKLNRDSPCINKGNATHSPQKDYEGNQRDPSPDIGAYEFKE